MGAWKHTFVKNMTPIQRCLHYVTIITLESDLKERSKQPSTVLNDVGHVRNQAEGLERSVLEVGLEEHKHLSRGFVCTVLRNFDILALSD